MRNWFVRNLSPALLLVFRLVRARFWRWSGTLCLAFACGGANAVPSYFAMDRDLVGEIPGIPINYFELDLDRQAEIGGVPVGPYIEWLTKPDPRLALVQYTQAGRFFNLGFAIDGILSYLITFRDLVGFVTAPLGRIEGSPGTPFAGQILDGTLTLLAENPCALPNPAQGCTAVSDASAPVPSTLALAGLGFLGLMWSGLRRRPALAGLQQA